jgi:hypothetical protein
MEKYPVQKFPVHRVIKFRLYQLLTGQLMTRRDLLTASAAGATGVAVDHVFNFAMANKATKELASAIFPKELIVNAEKFKKEFDRLGRYPLVPSRASHIFSPDQMNCLVEPVDSTILTVWPKASYVN